MKQRSISHFSNEGRISLRSLQVRSNPSLRWLIRPSITSSSATAAKWRQQTPSTHVQIETPALANMQRQHVGRRDNEMLVFTSPGWPLVVMLH